MVATDLIGEVVEYILPSGDEGYGKVRAVAYDQRSETLQGFVFLLLTMENEFLRVTLDQIKPGHDQAAGVREKVTELTSKAGI